MGPDSPESQHLQIEAMKLAFADTRRYVGEPKTMTVTPQHMLDADYLARGPKALTRAKRPFPAPEYSPPEEPYISRRPPKKA